MRRAFWLILLLYTLSSCITYKYRFPEYGSFNPERISEYHHNLIRTIETNNSKGHEGILIAYTDSTLMIAQEEDSIEVLIKHIRFFKANFVDDRAREMMEVKDHIKITRLTKTYDSDKRIIRGRIQEIQEMGIVVKSSKKTIYVNFENMKKVKFKMDVMGTVICNTPGALATTLLILLPFADFSVGYQL